jgi:HEPN domain-containing protein
MASSGPTKVRLNGEVHGTLKARSTRAVEAGEDISHDDFDGFSEYRLPGEDAGATHVTAIAHAGGWGVAFDFNARHPRRAEFLAAGLEFAATARESLEAGRRRAFREAAFAAAELLAKAELLSHGPAIEHVEHSRTHGGVRTPYNLWGNLRNTDPRFVKLLNRLDELREPSRYLDGPLRVKPEEDQEMLSLLLEMEAHVTKVVGGEFSGPINVYATRDIKAGELIAPDNHALTPPRSTD